MNAEMVATLKARRDTLAAQHEEAQAEVAERQAAFARAQEAQAKRQVAIAEQAEKAAQMAREQLLTGEGEVDASDLLDDIRSELLKREMERAQAPIAELSTQIAQAQQKMMAIGRQLGDADLQLAMLEREEKAEALVAEYDALCAKLVEHVGKMREHNRDVTRLAQQRNSQVSSMATSPRDARSQATASLCLPGAREEYKQQHQQQAQFVRRGVTVVLTPDLCNVYQDEDGLLATLPQPVQRVGGQYSGDGLVYRR